MSSPTERTLQVLSAEELAAYREHGFVRVREAFPREVADALRGEVWAELAEEHGILEEDPSTWAQPPRSPRRAKTSRTNERMVGPRLRGAISDVLGDDSWPEPRGWGGFLVTFPDRSPDPWDVPRDTWHWDAGPEVRTPLILSFYSEVGPGGGGTLVLAGSHRLLRAFYSSLSPPERALPHKVHRRMFSTWRLWLADLTGRAKEPGSDRMARFMEQTTEVDGVPCRVVELTGQPGDAILCNPMILHSPAPNRSDRPRIMRVKFFFGN